MNQTHRHCAIYQKLNWRLMTRVNRYNLIASWKKPGAYAIQQLPPQSSCCHVTPRISATKPGNGKVETAVNHPPIEHVTFFSEGWFEELHAKLPPGFFWTFVVSFFLILLATFIAWSEMWTLPCRKRSGLHKLQCTGACWEAQDLEFMHPNVLYVLQICRSHWFSFHS